MAQQATKQVGFRISDDDYTRIQALAGERGLSGFCRNAVLQVTRHIETTLGSNEQCQN